MSIYILDSIIVRATNLSIFIYLNLLTIEKLNQS